MNEVLAIRLTALYACPEAIALADGSMSGIVKTPLHSATAVGVNGLEGDNQADRRVHGGADKALHHFPAEHYAQLALRFPPLAARFAAGSIGENLSSNGVDEHRVHIGDVYAVGSLRVQLTQPRRPCWKIDEHFGGRGIAAWIRDAGCTGWYYRVLAAGRLAPGETLELIERDPAAPSVAACHALMTAQRPATEALARLGALRALPGELRERLRQRIDWLRRHG